MMSWWKSAPSPQKRADNLMSRGLEHLENGRTSDALAVAKELHSIRYSGGFEIEAQALAQKGAKEDAIAVLRKGLVVAPQSWLNANLLGNYLSDMERHEEAFAAYEQALRTPSANRILIEANHALALKRAGREDEARAKLDAILGQGLGNVERGLREFVQGLAADLHE